MLAIDHERSKRLFSVDFFLTCQSVGWVWDLTTTAKTSFDSIPMYDNMTTYMLSDSPESGSGSNHQISGGGGGGSSSNVPSLIGSPRSTPVFGNGHALKVWKSDEFVTLWLQCEQQRVNENWNYVVQFTLSTMKLIL